MGLSVIVLAALEADKLPDPFFMLAGGPGDAPSFNACFFSRVFHDIRRKRDIVLVDLRGTGKSSPLLCPELGQPGSERRLRRESPEHSRRARVPQRGWNRPRTCASTRPRSRSTISKRCGRRLGYGPINLYGTSYGIARRAGLHAALSASLRAVSMKGIVPPSMAAPEDRMPRPVRCGVAIRRRSLPQGCGVQRSLSTRRGRVP